MLVEVFKFNSRFAARVSREALGRKLKGVLMFRATFLVLLCVAAPSLIDAGGASYDLVIKRGHIFSSLANEDQFVLEVAGPTIFDAQILFRIVSWKGETIYADTFTVDQMMERGPDDPRTSTDSAHIVMAFSKFFEDENFTSPAIDDTTGYSNDNMISKDIWLEIWQDKSSVGFWFLLGAEDGRAIVFSKIQGRAIQYYGCC